MSGIVAGRSGRAKSPRSPMLPMPGRNQGMEHVSRVAFASNLDRWVASPDEQTCVLVVGAVGAQLPFSFRYLVSPEKLPVPAVSFPVRSNKVPCYIG